MIIRFIALTKYKNMQYRQKSQSHYDMRLTFFNSGCNFKFSHRKFTIPREEASKTAAQNPASLQTNPVILTIDCIVCKEK